MSLGCLAQAPPMRAGTDPDIVAITPISEIVAALLAHPRMVGNFISGSPAAAVIARVVSNKSAAASPSGKVSAPFAASAAKRVPGSMVSW